MSKSLLVVEKIGGGGSQDAVSIIRNAERFATEPDLVAVALSGPGGIYGRATERMINLTLRHHDEAEFGDVLAEAEQQFTAIAEGLGNVGLADTTMKEIAADLKHGYGYDWIRMRPEYFIRSAYQYVLEQAGVRTHLVNPVNSMFVTPAGRLDERRTYRGLQREMRDDALNLLVGFAARREDLTMDNMSRGSTDLVGAAASAALKEKYTDKEVRYILRKDDVMGIMRVSPKIDPEAEIADELSTGEVEALALGGAEVVHPAVLKLVEDTWKLGDGVLMDVRNTSDLQHPGTRIVPLAKRNLDPQRPIAGISSQDVDAYKWADPTRNDPPGAVRSVSKVFADHAISITDVQTGQGGVIETYVPSDAARRHRRLKADLERVDGAAARVGIDRGQELIVVVGDGLRQPHTYPQVLSGIFALAANRRVALGSINHIGGEPTISFTVPKKQAAGIIRAIYGEFFKK